MANNKAQVRADKVRSAIDKGVNKAGGAIWSRSPFNPTGKTGKKLAFANSSQRFINAVAKPYNEIYNMGLNSHAAVSKGINKVKQSIQARAKGK